MKFSDKRKILQTQPLTWFEAVCGIMSAIILLIGFSSGAWEAIKQIGSWIGF